MDEIEKLYSVLELHPGATTEEVRDAYLDLVKVWHPDRYQKESPRLRGKAEQKLKAINDAYERIRGINNGASFRHAPEPERPAEEFRLAVDLFAYNFGERWGFVNREGKLVIAPRFDTADQFSEGLALVSGAS